MDTKKIPISVEIRIFHKYAYIYTKKGLESTGI